MWFWTQRCEFMSGFETKNWPALWEAPSSSVFAVMQVSLITKFQPPFALCVTIELAREPHTLSPLCIKLSLLK